MATRSRRYTVRFDEDLFIRAEHRADELGITPADLLRRALEAFLSGSKRRTESDLRLLRISEYNQAALHTIILENHPEFRDRIVAETDRRMARYHTGS